MWLVSKEGKTAKKKKRQIFCGLTDQRAPMAAL